MRRRHWRRHRRRRRRRHRRRHRRRRRRRPRSAPSSRAHRAVRLDAATHERLHREIFDAGAGVATCVMTGDGVCLAARRGVLTAVEFVALVCRAEFAEPIVTKLVEDLSRLPLRGRRDAQRRATFLLAEAYLAAGNPFAAYRYFTLVTLLAPPGTGDQSEVLRACERLARIEIERGNHRESREWLDDLRERDRERTAHRDEIRLTEAILARAERRVADAHAILTQLKADPSHCEFDRVLLEYGRACHESGRDGEARRAFQDVADADPRSPWRPAALRELQHFGDPEPAHGPGGHTHPASTANQAMSGAQGFRRRSLRGIAPRWTDRRDGRDRGRRRACADRGREEVRRAVRWHGVRGRRG